MAAPEADHPARVRDLLAAFAGGPEAMQAGVRRHFAADCAWSNPGFPTTTGPEEAIALMLESERAIGVSYIEIEVKHLVSEGAVVMSERVDTLYREDGTEIVALPIAGIIEFSRGQMIRWREYFDTIPLQSLAAAR